MNKLVNQINIGGQAVPVVTSRQVSEDFEKGHKHILETIRNLIAENSAVKNMIIESEYEARGKKYPEYLLTRDGFSLLVMGFTGSKALSWKLKYIESFNEMEKSLSKPRALTPKEELKLHYAVLEEHEEKLTQIDNKIDDLEKNMPLFNIECKELQAAVRKKGMTLLGGKDSQAYKNNSLRGKVYADIQYQLKRQFGVNRYEAIKRGQLDKAYKILAEYVLPMALKDEIYIVNNQIGIGEVV